jgi:hypothetical protein
MGGAPNTSFPRRRESSPCRPSGTGPTSEVLTRRFSGGDTSRWGGRRKRLPRTSRPRKVVVGAPQCPDCALSLVGPSPCAACPAGPEYSRGGRRGEAISSYAIVDSPIAAPDDEVENRLQPPSVESGLSESHTTLVSDFPLTLSNRSWANGLRSNLVSPSRISSLRMRPTVGACWNP